jgi:ribonuclease D
VLLSSRLTRAFEGETAHPPPQWVRTAGDLQQLAGRLAKARVIGMDSEADSLYRFPERVCLVQIADEAGTVFFVDPLAIPDLSPLAPVCADAGVVKVFHGASYDLSGMKRDFGFRFAGLFDTMVAGQFLGLAEIGLASLLERCFRIAPGPSRQKDDWGQRPLSVEQEAYAARDVRHLILLRQLLLGELQALGREGWAQEECQALADLPAFQRSFEPEDYARLKGAKSLDGRGLAVLRELFVIREVWAREAGRPPFKVLGNELLIRLAVEQPHTPSALNTIPGCSPKVILRHGAAVLAAIARARAIPEAELPRLPRSRKVWVPPAVRRRMEALSRWRTSAAGEFGLDPGLVLPRRLMERLAETVPADRDALERIEGLRRWRIAAFGQEILDALAGR